MHTLIRQFEAMKACDISAEKIKQTGNLFILCTNSLAALLTSLLGSSEAAGLFFFGLGLLLR
jgi:hypothetical protein